MSTRLSQVPSPSLSARAVTGRQYRFGFVVEHAFGPAGLADMLQDAVDADPEVVGEWFVHREEAGNPLEWLSPFRSGPSRPLVSRRRSNLDAILVCTRRPVTSPRMMEHLPTVMCTHGTRRPIDDRSRPARLAVGGGLEAAVERRLIGATMRRAALVIPWSERAARSVIDEYRVPPGRVRLVRPGIYPERWPVRTDYRLDGRARFLFVAGDFRRSGGADLLAALHRTPGDWHLDVVSKGPVPPHPRVRIHQYGTGLTQLYRRADVFVAPADDGSHGWEIPEAMAAGLPVVSTSAHALAELVDEGRTGFVVRPGDRVGLAAVLKRLVMSAELRARLGGTARQKVLSCHNAHLNLQTVLSLLKSVSWPDVDVPASTPVGRRERVLAGRPGHG